PPVRPGRAGAGRAHPQKAADLRGAHASAPGEDPARAAAREAGRLALLRLPPLGRDRLPAARPGSRRRPLAAVVLPGPGAGSAAEARARHRAARAGRRPRNRRDLLLPADPPPPTRPPPARGP